LRARLDRIAEHPARNSWGEPRVGPHMLNRARTAMADINQPGRRRQSYESLLRAILAFEGSSFVHWFEDDHDLPEYLPRPTFCFGCGAQGRLFRLRSRYSTRWLACCTQCDSFYADTPEGSDLIDAHFGVRASGQIVHSLPNQPNSVILLNLRSSLEARNTWLLGEEFDYAARPPGRSWLWLHALSDAGLFAYSRILDNRPIKSRSLHAR
jgi:hypothetical protein